MRDMLATLPTAPDWATVQEDVHCPLCKYNLRGLIEPRCPECGYRFTWPQVLHPERHEHPYLFEHHPECNFWSFIRTVAGGLLPQRFWKGLHPAQPSDPFRLIVYFLILLVFAALPELITATVGVPASVQTVTPVVPRYRITNTAVLRRLPGIVTTRLVILPLTRSSIAKPLLTGTVLIACLPFLNAMFLLMMLPASGSPRGIRAIHILRSVIYSYDIVVPLCAASLLFLGSNRALASSVGEHTHVVYSAVAIMTFSLWPIFTYRLYTAYRLYLRMRSSLAIVLLAQLLCVMIVLAIAIQLRRLVN
jgi:hypothetical protein